MGALVTGLVLIIVFTVVLVFTGHPDAAWVLGNVGTLAWMMLVLAYITFIDSKKRWPGESWVQRLGSVMSFRRD